MKKRAEVKPGRGKENPPAQKQEIKLHWKGKKRGSGTKTEKGRDEGLKSCWEEEEGRGEE